MRRRVRYLSLRGGPERRDHAGPWGLVGREVPAMLILHRGGYSSTTPAG